mmetsp:Transcript_31988/g.90804  ORF Transcript_31988/g.90804 Transcript_31988/m.90804 type:complete len:238 (+) Transcript_31988:195-908(+)|eukprot:CAMPEP_0117657014 /NCGR_PEP_ID=MMETSP0804-20121206/5108_1 /TAXON_ID=1074897 /ORGANISM="Tetraselmis astigmatica, Strain CCMP880" /LENGTH=237 /DNA_ID=CAMNT_0005463447 /DNA_START=158 /DNA_END=871 /DNA_ORIENTATION=+
MDAYLGLLRECATALLEGHLPPPEPLKALISKTLGYGIVAGASLLKVPQVAKVAGAGSAEGLSALTFEIEQVAYGSHMLYSSLRGLPFSAYGEVFLILIQNFVLLGLVYYHKNASKGPVILKLAVFLGLLFAGYSGSIPGSYIDAVYSANILMVISARVPQIYANAKARSTGQLSVITTGLSFLGGLARVFTSVADKAGDSMVVNFAIASALNATLLVQILFYGSSRKPGKDEKKKQ